MSKEFIKKYPSIPLTSEEIDLQMGIDRKALVGNVGLVQPFLPEDTALEFGDAGAASKNLLFVKAKSGETFSSVLKTSYVEAEFEGRKLIQDYLKVLPAKIVSDREGSKYFILPFRNAPTMEYLLNQDSPSVIKALKRMTTDLEIMWNSTRKPLQRDKLARDYSEMTKSTIDKIATAAVEDLFGGDSSVMDKTLFVNGQKIGIPRQIFENMKKAISTPPVNMVLTHGDEIGSNVLVLTKNGEIDYRLIDTRLAGYYDQSWILAYQLFTRMHVFNTHFGDKCKVDISENEVQIKDFSPIQTETTQEAKSVVLSFIDKTIMSTEDLERTAAYAFASIARSTAFLRDARWHDLCKKYQLDHFIEGLRAYNEIMSLQEKTFIMRHGTDILLETGHHNGWAPDNPLSNKGVKQAEEMAKKLKDKRVTIIISSDILRAKQTAEIVSSIIGVPIILDKRLRDRRRSKQMEGMHYTEFTNLDIYSDWEKNRNNPNFSLPDGESLNDVSERLESLVEDLETKYKEERTLIISHNDTLDALSKILTGKYLSKHKMETGSVLAIENKKKPASLN